MLCSIYFVLKCTTQFRSMYLMYCGLANLGLSLVLELHSMAGAQVKMVGAGVGGAQRGPVYALVTYTVRRCEGSRYDPLLLKRMLFCNIHSWLGRT